MCCCGHSIPLNLDSIAKVSQIVIASSTLLLGYFVFVYNKTKDSRTALLTAQSNERTIKLQWFKELVIQPNLTHLYSFFENLESLKQKITSDNLVDDDALSLNRYVNDLASEFRKNFYDILLSIDSNLYNEIKTNIDELVTKLTTAISNDEHKLTNEKTYNKVILDPITSSKNQLLSSLFKYRG
jgi:hypothetical protein